MTTAGILIHTHVPKSQNSTIYDIDVKMGGRGKVVKAKMKIVSGVLIT